MNKKKNIPVGFDSEYNIYEKIENNEESDNDQSDIESINENYESDVSERTETENTSDESKFIEEINNNYSFIKKKVKLEQHKKPIEELKEENYDSD